MNKSRFDPWLSKFTSCPVEPIYKSVEEIFWCDYSNESFLATLSYGAVYDAVQCGSNF